MNFADRRSSLVQDDGNAIGRRFQNLSEEHLAALLEGSLFGSLNIRPNLAMRFSYDIMYITGVGIAPYNLGLDDVFPPFSTTGGAVYHGASAGFEATW
jgi:hypothetical protein